MKKLYILFFIFIFSCQTEENILVEDNSQNIKPSLPLHLFLERVNQNNTSVDNILDGTSAIKVKLPVQITLNNTVLIVNDSNDYILVENLKNQSASDDDIVNYQFPITIELRNYQNITVSNQSQLNNIINNNQNISEISCINIQFPISINLYNSNSQIANTIDFSNKIQLMNFLSNASNDLIYQLKYPLVFIDPNTVPQTVNSNLQTLSLIENAINICGNNAGNFDDFVTIITSGNWKIDYLFEDNENQTNDFIGYAFSFLSNGSILVQKNGVSYNGTWQYYEDSGSYKFDIEFDEDDFDDIEEDWNIIEFSNNIVYLKDGDNFLTFSKL